MPQERRPPLERRPLEARPLEARPLERQPQESQSLEHQSPPDAIRPVASPAPHRLRRAAAPGWAQARSTAEK